MTSLLDGLDLGGIEATVKEDTLNTGYEWETGLYDCTLNMAYLATNNWGNNTINYVFESDEGRTLKISEVFADKDNKVYSEFTKGKQTIRAGYRRLLDFGSVICDSENVADFKPTKKLVKVYDYDESKEVEKEFDVLMAFVGQKVTLGVVRVINNKKSLNDDGSWSTLNEEKITNVIDKIFRYSDKATVGEINKGKLTGGDVEAEFHADWEEAKKGKDRNNYKETKGGGKGGKGSKTTKNIFKTK